MPTRPIPPPLDILPMGRVTIPVHASALRQALPPMPDLSTAEGFAVALSALGARPGVYRTVELLVERADTELRTVKIAIPRELGEHSIAEREYILVELAKLLPRVNG